MQNRYTSFLLWKDNISLSSGSLYKDFTAQSLVERDHLGSNQTTQSRTKDAQRLFKRTKDTHKKEIMANRHFVFFQLKAVRKPWWNHKPLPFVFTKHFFHAIESFYRPLVMSNRSFIITETFRWQIFYNVNYRR